MKKAILLPSRARLARIQPNRAETDFGAMLKYTRHVESARSRCRRSKDTSTTGSGSGNARNAPKSGCRKLLIADGCTMHASAAGYIWRRRPGAAGRLIDLAFKSAQQQCSAAPGERPNRKTDRVSGIDIAI